MFLATTAISIKPVVKTNRPIRVLVEGVSSRISHPPTPTNKGVTPLAMG